MMRRYARGVVLGGIVVLHLVLLLSGCLLTGDKELTRAEFDEHLHRERERWKMEQDRKIAEQELVEQEWIRYGMFVCIGLAGVSAVGAYLTKHVKKLGGLALVFVGLSLALAVLADVLKLVHSWWFLPAVLGLAGSFYLFRNVDLPAWWANRKTTKEPGL